MEVLQLGLVDHTRSCFVILGMMLAAFESWFVEQIILYGIN
jgi:hypothetical protein